MSYLDAYVPQCKIFEGCVAWMYLDTKGLVTAGVGNMLPSVAEALKLPFRIQASGDLAGAPAVEYDFDRVRNMQPGRLPRYYYEYDSLILHDADIDALLMSRLVGFDRQLRNDFIRFDTYPDCVKMAMLDMAFNLGEERFEKTYPHLCAAIRSQDWTTAADQCVRNADDAAFGSRNAWTRKQFLSAVPL